MFSHLLNKVENNYLIKQIYGDFLREMKKNENEKACWFIIINTILYPITLVYKI